MSMRCSQVEKLDPTMDQWLPAGKTKGTSIDIRNLAEGRAYKFLVRAVSAEGDSPDLETEEAVTAKDPFDPPTPPQKVSSLQGDHGGWINGHSSRTTADL